MHNQPEAFICEAVRTPIGRFGGALSGVRADDLASLPIKALMARLPNLDWSAVEEVILGAANQSGEDNRNIGRMAALLAGLPHAVPGVTVNRLCASGLDAVGAAARMIRSGELDLVLAGGSESMTRAPFVMAKAETAFSRKMQLEDTSLGWRFVNEHMLAQYGVETMPQTGENVARDYAVSREDQDAFAARSQAKAATAQRSGFFAKEIVPVEVKDSKGRASVFEQDEHLRPDTTPETLAGLRPLFPPDGSVTAGNAAGLNDGAAAMIIASEAAAVRYNLVPRARILGMATAGVEPRVMGIGPVPATSKLLARLGLVISDFDFVEINEAFASQALAVVRAFGFRDDADHVNPHGGAIALGHPLGMSGARLAMTATHTLEKTGAQLALCTLCVGVGQGVALALERV